MNNIDRFRYAAVFDADEVFLPNLHDPKQNKCIYGENFTEYI
jgi:hypothetical protein